MHNANLTAIRRAADPHLQYWDPEQPIASQLLADHLLRHAVPACQALTIADAFTSQASIGSPISKGPISAAYQAPLDDLIQSNPGPERRAQVWSHALAVARLPQSATPAGFARALRAMADASALAIPPALDAAAPRVRTETIHIRVTPFEAQCLQRAAARHNPPGDLSAYIRAAIDAYGRN